MKKVLLSLVVTGVLLGVVGGIAYRHWKQMPAYSLAQIHRAVKTHDLRLFEKYVDVKGFVTRFVDDTIDMSVRRQQALDTEG